CLEVTCFLPTGVARGHRDQRQASGRRLQEGAQECDCKGLSSKFFLDPLLNLTLLTDWFLRASERKLMTVPRLPKKPCPCDRFKGRVKKTRHQRHHRSPNKHSRACQQFLRRCQLASFALPL
ncbi:C-X-C motif chemokine 17, partial [Camelus dromedarius]